MFNVIYGPDIQTFLTRSFKGLRRGVIVGGFLTTVLTVGREGKGTPFSLTKGTPVNTLPGR